MWVLNLLCTYPHNQIKRYTTFTIRDWLIGFINKSLPHFWQSLKQCVVSTAAKIHTQMGDDESSSCLWGLISMSRRFFEDYLDTLKKTTHDQPVVVVVVCERGQEQKSRDFNDHGIYSVGFFIFCWRSFTNITTSPSDATTICVTF